MRSPLTSLSIAVSDMSDTNHSVIIDMIMVQVISLALGSLVILLFSMNTLTPQELTWMLLSAFVSFSMVGVVYRSLSRAA